MHSVAQSQIRHNIFSKVNHDKSFVRQHAQEDKAKKTPSKTLSSSHKSNSNTHGSSSSQGLITPPIGSPALSRQVSGSFRSATDPAPPIRRELDAALPSIDLDVRRKLAHHDLAVKMATRSQVFTSASAMGRESASQRDRERFTPATPATSKEKERERANVNIFGADDREEYARLQIGYVESELDETEGDRDRDRDVFSDSFSHAANEDEQSLTRSTFNNNNNIARIEESEEEEEERLGENPFTRRDLSLSQHYADDDDLAAAMYNTPTKSLFDDNDDDGGAHRVSVTDPRQYASPLDAHKKFLHVSKVKNRLQAIQALSAQKILPAEEMLNEHKRAKLVLKNVSSSPNLSHKSILSRERDKERGTGPAGEREKERENDNVSVSSGHSLSRSAPSPSLSRSLSHSASFRFVSSLSKPLQSLGLIAEQEHDEQDLSQSDLHANDALALSPSLSHAEGLTFQTPLDSMHKPIISRKVTASTFQRFHSGKSAATVLRALQRLDNDHNELLGNANAAAGEGEGARAKSAYHVPALSHLAEDAQSSANANTANTTSMTTKRQFLRSVDSAINALTFVPAEEKRAPPPPRKASLSLESVFGGADGLLIKAEVPALQEDDEEYERLLRDPHAIEREKEQREQRERELQREREKQEARAKIVREANAALAELPSSPERRQRRDEQRTLRAREKERERELFTDIKTAALTALEREREEKEQEKEKDKNRGADAAQGSPDAKLAKYARALSKSAQAFVSSFLVHKEKRERGTQPGDDEPRVALPYDEGQSDVQCMPRPHPLTAPAAHTLLSHNTEYPHTSPSHNTHNAHTSPSHKSILKSAGSSPSMSIKKRVVLVDTTPCAAATAANAVSAPPARVTAEDGLQFAFQYSTHSYVPAEYVNESEFGAHYRGKTRDEVEREREKDGLDAFSEREKRELRDDAPVIFLPPNRFHVPLVADNESSNNNLNAFSSSVLMPSLDKTANTNSANTSAGLVYSPQHSRSLYNLSNPLLTRTPAASAANRTIAAQGSSQSVFEDEEDEDVDDEFYAHMLMGSALQTIENGDNNASPLREETKQEEGEGEGEGEGETERKRESAFRAVPRNEKIFSPGVVVAGTSFPQVMREVVFPAHVAEHPHVVHYDAGLYAHVDVPPSVRASEGESALGEKSESPLSALTKHHEKLSAQLLARQHARAGAPGAETNTSALARCPSSPVESLAALLSASSAAVSTPIVLDRARPAKQERERERVVVPPLTATSLESLHRTQQAQPATAFKSPSAASTASEDLKKKFMRSNPQLLQVASSVDLRDEILQFMKQSNSSIAGQYEQYVENTFKRPQSFSSCAAGEQDWGRVVEEENEEDASLNSDDLRAPTSFYLTNNSSMSSITNATFAVPTSSSHTRAALSMGGKLALESSSSYSPSASPSFTPNSKENAYKRLKANLDKRYEDDPEGRFHMKQRIKDYLHEGVKEEYKLMHTYLDEMEDWK